MAGTAQQPLVPQVCTLLTPPVPWPTHPTTHPPRSLTVALAVGTVVLLVVGHQVGQREAVVGNDKVDGVEGLALVGVVQVSGARQPRGKLRLQAAVAPSWVGGVGRLGRGGWGWDGANWALGGKAPGSLQPSPNSCKKQTQQSKRTQACHPGQCAACHSPQEPPDVVAVLAVPLRPDVPVGEGAHHVGANVPGLADQLDLSLLWIGWVGFGFECWRSSVAGSQLNGCQHMLKSMGAVKGTLAAK